jgi:hypothetical protein
MRAVKTEYQFCIATLFSTPAFPKKLLPPGRLMSIDGEESLLLEVLNSPIAFAKSTKFPSEIGKF